MWIAQLSHVRSTGVDELEMSTEDALTPALATGRELARPVRTEADLASLSPDDRLRVAAWLSALNLPACLPPKARRRRRTFLLIATAAAAALIPWIASLAVTLPNRHGTHAWRAAWVGFDLALAASFAATAWSGWRGRQVVITSLIVTATLLLCDAWFDLALSWGGPDQAASIVAAVAVELPLALFLLGVCHAILGALTAQAWRDRGRPGSPPPLRHVQLLLRAESPDAIPLC